MKIAEAKNKLLGGLLRFMAIVTMKQLLETGVHFGHRTRRWNPKMARYIYTERNNVHIIDLQQTVKALELAYGIVRDIVAQGEQVLFIGTKRQAQESIRQEATRCNMPYVNQRWLGGTLTNWRTIKQRIDHLKSLEARRDAGEFELLTKKEGLMLTREIDKLNLRLGGVKDMEKLPGAVFVIDVKNEITSIKEADRMGIPIVAVVDTNCDPDYIDHVIPANDDAIRAIRLMTSKIADAVLEGLALRKELAPEEEEIFAEDEKYLSAETLARLRKIQFEDEDEEKAYYETAEASTVESDTAEDLVSTDVEAAPIIAEEIAQDPLADTVVVDDSIEDDDITDDDITDDDIEEETEGEQE
jgi:small subunit ribosomal protein S2